MPCAPAPCTSTSRSPSRSTPDGDDDWPEDLDGRPDGRPWTADSRLVAGMSTPLDDVLDALLDDERVPARGIVILGDHDDTEAVELIDELADALGWPVIAEPSGNGAGCSTALSHGPLLLADAAFADAHVPEIVVTIGRVGLNRSVLRMIARAGLHVAVDTQPEWSDPTRTADVVVASVPLPPTEAEIDDAWLESWQRADVLAAAAVETALFLPDDGLTGMHVARITATAVPDGGLLFVGPSWSVRHVGSFAANTVQDAVILGNRGTSGIDGCVSTRVGRRGRPAAQRRGRGTRAHGRPDVPVRQQRPARARGGGAARPRHRRLGQRRRRHLLVAGAGRARSTRRRSSGCSACRWASTSRPSRRRWASPS